jgi:hypothetical protein
MDRFVFRAALIMTFLILWMGLGGCASAQADEILKLEIAYQSIAAVDMLQTLNIENEHWCEETNRLLGKHPSNKEVISYFIATGVIHAIITSKLPVKYARVFEYVTIGFEAGTVAHNYSIGMRIKM